MRKTKEKIEEKSNYDNEYLYKPEICKEKIKIIGKGQIRKCSVCEKENILGVLTDKNIEICDDCLNEFEIIK